MALPTAGLRLDDRYELLEPALDRGLGVPWRACDAAQGGREVLVKFLREGTANAALECLRGVGPLRHESIPALLRHGRWGDRTYLVFEASAGDSLGTRLDRARKGGDPLDLAWLRPVGDSVARALAAAHGAAIPVRHGALTPGSVIVRESANRAVSLLDLGIAALADPPPDLPARSARALTTPVPEYVSGAAPTVSGDVSALGALLREMLATPAVEGQTVAPVLAGRRRPDVPAEVWAVIDHATQLDPAARPASIDALRSALDAAWGRSTRRSAFDALLDAAPAHKSSSLLDETTHNSGAPPRLDGPPPPPSARKVVEALAPLPVSTSGPLPLPKLPAANLSGDENPWSTQVRLAEVVMPVLPPPGEPDDMNKTLLVGAAPPKWPGTDPPLEATLVPAGPQGLYHAPPTPPMNDPSDTMQASAPLPRAVPAPSPPAQPQPVSPPQNAWRVVVAALLVIAAAAAALWVGRR